MWAEGSDNHVKAFFFLRLLTIENSEFRISTSTYRIQHRRLSHPVRMFADIFSVYYADSKIPTEIRNRVKTLISLRVIPKIKWQDTIRNEELRTPSKKLVFGHGDEFCAPLRRPGKNNT